MVQAINKGVTVQGESFKTWFFRHGMNLYPMFFCTGGKVLYIQKDWKCARVQLKFGLRTRNYVGTIFGGSQFSAVDPFHIVLLINIFKKKYVVWDKAAEIKFKKPGRGKLRTEVRYEDEEIKYIQQQAEEHGRYEFVKTVEWIDEEGDVVSTVSKTIYVATKEYFRQRQKEKSERKSVSDQNS
ncbi:DUF4442 domain-containing protein [Pseudobdellovibrio exovorus]|uniref:DUF4442 domain-containing protein n=1 Tax=Pseudobdellovibrio exovorus TaxID=453816 RepID=UPI00130DDCEB|nr:DUF4442 domain-containing protein [Pseudobdellovibrio exovorus]